MKVRISPDSPNSAPDLLVTWSFSEISQCRDQNLYLYTLYSFVGNSYMGMVYGILHKIALNALEVNVN